MARLCELIRGQLALLVQALQRQQPLHQRAWARAGGVNVFLHPARRLHSRGDSYTVNSGRVKTPAQCRKISEFMRSRPMAERTTVEASARATSSAAPAAGRRRLQSRLVAGGGRGATRGAPSA